MAYGVDRLPEPEEAEEDFEVEFDQVDGLTQRRVFQREEEPIIPPDVNDRRHAAPLYLRPQIRGVVYPGSSHTSLTTPEAAHA